MKKENHISRYLTYVGELFAIIARLTADELNGADIEASMREVSPKILKQCKWIRNSAEMYFEIETPVVTPPDMSAYLSFSKSKNSNLLLFDLAGNLLRAASYEIDTFLDTNDPRNSMVIIELNLKAIEMVASEATDA